MQQQRMSSVVCMLLPTREASGDGAYRFAQTPGVWGCRFALVHSRMGDSTTMQSSMHMLLQQPHGGRCIRGGGDSTHKFCPKTISTAN
jgi:hypothetical protein